MRRKFSFGNPKGTGHLKNLGVDERIILYGSQRNNL
jgi:hypothetical protein